MESSIALQMKTTGKGRSLSIFLILQESVLKVHKSALHIPWHQTKICL